MIPFVPVTPWILGAFLGAGDRSHGACLAGFLMPAAFGLAAVVGMAFFKAPAKPAPEPAPRG